MVSNPRLEATGSRVWQAESVGGAVDRGIDDRDPAAQRLDAHAVGRARLRGARPRAPRRDSMRVDLAMPCMP